MSNEELAEEKARARRYQMFVMDEVWWETAEEAHDDGFSAGRTVDAEMIEPVAVRLFLMNDGSSPWAATDEGVKQAWRNVASDLFTEAGFIVEEDA